MTDDPIPLDEERRKRREGRGGGKRGVRSAIQAAAEAKPAEDGPAAAPADETTGNRFDMRPWGLYFKPNEDKRAFRISGYFDVLSETREDDTQTWGLLLRFHDRDGVQQQVVISRDMFHGESAELRGLLSRRGLYLNPSQSARQALTPSLAFFPPYTVTTTENP